jgi:hypothetical protein
MLRVSETQSYKILNESERAATVSNLLAAVAGSVLLAAPFAAWLMGVTP